MKVEQVIRILSDGPIKDRDKDESAFTAFWFLQKSR